MQKVVIYGYGSYYEKYRIELEKQYDIIAISGKLTEDSKKYDNYIIPNEIEKLEYDKIIIMSQFYEEILEYLIDTLKISYNKIEIHNELIGNDSMFHSEYNEDAIVLLILKALKIKIEDVTYLDVGCNHPIIANNTYYFYKNGAKGVVVEPNQYYHRLIKCVRSRDVFIDKAVDVENQKNVKFYRLIGDGVSTLKYDYIDKELISSNRAFEVRETYDVDTININDIMSEMEKTPTIISLDIEGLDLDVLKTVNFELYKPEIIIVELAPLGKTNNAEKIINVLNANKYKCIAKGINAIAVKEEKYEEIIGGIGLI